jgi:hypothetical protein
MRRLAVLAAATAVALIPALVPGTAGAVRGGPDTARAHASGVAPHGWSQAVPFRQQVVSSPVAGGGYPGAKPAPGGCVRARYDSNFSEGALALRRGTDQLVGASKAYFGRWSTFKSEHTVSFSLARHRTHRHHGRLRARTHFIGGFDCVTTGTQAMPPSWTNATDPNLVWDRGGRIHQLVLAFNAFWGTVKQPNGNVYSVYSDDAGRTWKPGNGGRPVDAGPELSVDSTTFLDKPWITANQNASDPRRGHLYGAWVLFKGDGAEIHTAVSRNHGRSWTKAEAVPTPQTLGPSNPWPMVAVGADGVVHLSYVSYGKPSAGGVPATLWSARSTDDGRTWSGFSRVARTTAIGSSKLPGTTLHRSIVQYLAVSPDRPGRLYVAWNRLRHGQVDVMLAASHDNGRTWSRPRRVNDDHGSRHQFSATVAAGPRGAVAVGFYDMRARCPRHDPAILRAHRGRAGTCIGLTLQPFHDGAHGLRATRSNLLVSRHLWDPYQPGGTRRGLRQQACEDATTECHNIFLGDYFSMQISGRRVYLLSASTHPRSRIRGDDGRRLHYQQQLLTTVARRNLGL